MSGYQVPALDSNLLASVSYELKEKERKQQKHYTLLQELQTMTREVPSKYQQKLPYNVLSDLANSLLDGTVTAITQQLKELQRMEEESLYANRRKLLLELSDEKRRLVATHKDRIQLAESSPHNLLRVTEQNEEEMTKFEKKKQHEIKMYDMRTITRLDQKAMEQQSMLEKAAVPGFFVTNDPDDIRLQRYLLDFITRISNSAPV